MTDDAYHFADDPRVKIQWNVPLAPYTTFRLGGPCRGLVTCLDEEAMEQVARELVERGDAFIVLGEGSNVLVSDRGYEGLVVRYFSPAPAIRRDGWTLVASGATRLDDLARFSAEQGLEGLVAASGIPGTVGGAVAGNAGAYGWHIGQSVERVTLMGRDGVKKQTPKAEMGFQYRQSRLGRTGEIVLSAAFRVADADEEDLVRVRESLLAERAARLPDWRKVPCAGSFFRNPDPPEAGAPRPSAGRLLEQAGALGLTRGGARVYEKHANVIVRASDDCRAQDVYDLALEMARRVREKFGVHLVPEVQLLGAFDGTPLLPP